jgi:hypothetical protein
MSNVTINGKLPFAVDKGKFYLLDEDNREFEAVVIQKAITPPGAPPAQ